MPNVLFAESILCPAGLIIGISIAVFVLFIVGCLLVLAGSIYHIKKHHEDIRKPQEESTFVADLSVISFQTDNSRNSVVVSKDDSKDIDLDTDSSKNSNVMQI